MIKTMDDLIKDGEDFLQHHGVKGQKWGVRNGPPYPLGSDVSTGKRLKTKQPSKGVSELAFFAIVGLAYFTPILAVAAGMGIHQRKINKRAKKYDEERRNSKIDKKTGLHLKQKELTEKEDADRVNIDQRTSSKEKTLGDASGRRSNCTTCTYIYELRRRGYDEKASSEAPGRLATQDFTKKLFKNVKFNQELTIEKYDKKKKKWLIDEDKVKQLRVKDIQDAQFGLNKNFANKMMNNLSKEKPGSRGQLLLTWNTYGSGHSLNYEIKSDGKIRLIDPQIGKVYDSPRAVRKYLGHAISGEYARLDDKPMNISLYKKKGLIGK